jgi:hypothetical protein
MIEERRSTFTLSNETISEVETGNRAPKIQAKSSIHREERQTSLFKPAIFDMVAAI